MASKKPKAAEAPAANDAAGGELVVLPPATPTHWELMDDANSTCDNLFAAVIDSPMMYELAAAELLELQAKHKAIEDKRFSITRPMDAAKKAVMALFGPALDRINGEIATRKAAMLAYTKEEQRKAALRQLTLDKIAEEQRAQLAAEAKKQADLAAAEHERAKQLMDAGNTEGVAEALTKAEEAHDMAMALKQTTGVVTAATAAANVPTVGGITTADVWKARVTDPAALLRYIADHPEYLDWIEFKMTGLNDMAKSQRTELRIPGVEAFEEARISATRKAA